MGRLNLWALSLLLPSLARLACADYEALDETIKQAVNKGFSWQPDPWEKALQSAPRLYLANIWRPDSASQPTEQRQLPITIFTALSVGRLPQLMQQCASFNGPIVASVWTPIVLPQGTPAVEGAQPSAAGAGTSGAQQTVSTTRTVNINMQLSTTTTVTSRQAQPMQQQGTAAPAHGQRMLHDTATATFDDIPSAAAAQLADAWEEIEQLFAIMRQRRSLMAAGGGGGFSGLGLGQFGGTTTDQTAGGDLPEGGAGTEGEQEEEEGEEDGDMGMGGPGCDLTVLMFAQPVADAAAATFLFPINSLRNYAGLMARTPLVAMVDVDLVINAHFAADLVSNSSRLQELESLAASGGLMVLPAFEAVRCQAPACADGFADGLAAARGSKELVSSMFKNGSLDVFHCNKGLHFSTDYMRWLRSQHSFQIPYVQGAEPWYIGHRSIIPFYDNRFVGFGFNKQLQVMNAAGSMGLRMHVLPDAWLVHLPHNRTVASKTFDNRRQFGNHTGGRSGTRSSVYARSVRLGSLNSFANKLFAMRRSFNTTRLRARVAAMRSGAVAAAFRGNASGGVAAAQVRVIPSAGIQALRKRAADASADAVGGTVTTPRVIARSQEQGQEQQASEATQQQQQPGASPTAQGAASLPRWSPATTQQQNGAAAAAAVARRVLLDMPATAPDTTQPPSQSPTTTPMNPETATAPTSNTSASNTLPSLPLAIIRTILPTGLQNAGSAAPPPPPETAHDRYGRVFHRYMHSLGRPLRYAADARLPPDYLPRLDAGMVQLLNELPWWSDYRAAWKAGQPSVSDHPDGFGALKCVSQKEDVQALRAQIKVCSPRLGASPQQQPFPPPRQQ